MELVPANAEQMEKIMTDINLNEVQHRADTIALKEWLQNQPHLPHDLGRYAVKINTKCYTRFEIGSSPRKVRLNVRISLDV